MSLDLKPVQVRLPHDAYAALKLLADADDMDLGEKARELLTNSVLGAAHSLKVVAERYNRALGTDNGRQSAVEHAKARR